MSFPTRRRRLALTPRERRRQVVGILAATLARMPLAAPVPHAWRDAMKPLFWLIAYAVIAVPLMWLTSGR